VATNDKRGRCCIGMCYRRSCKCADYTTWILPADHRGKDCELRKSRNAATLRVGNAFQSAGAGALNTASETGEEATGAVSPHPQRSHDIRGDARAVVVVYPAGAANPTANVQIKRQRGRGLSRRSTHTAGGKCRHPDEGCTHRHLSMRSNALKVSCGPIHAQAHQPCYTNLVQALHSCLTCSTASPNR